MADLIYKQEFYDIFGICMNLYKTLGRGFLGKYYGFLKKPILQF